MSITDELRSMAASVGLEMPQAATLMMEAADAIAELRGALHVASVDYRQLQAETDTLREHAARLFDKTLELGTENSKLRNEVDNLLDFEHLTSVAVAYAGCDECGEYKQTMLRLFAENAKLRELARLVSEYISHDRCEGCVVKTACNSHELDECWMTTKLRNQLRELGMGVDE